MDHTEEAQFIRGLRRQVPSMLDDQESNLTFCSLLPTGMFSDVTLVACSGQEFEAHKLVFWCQSPVFAAILGGQSKRAEESIVHVDDDPDVLAVLLLHHLYKFGSWEAVAPAAKKMTFAVRVYAIADKYDVSHLRDQAVADLRGLLNPEIDLEDYIAAIKAVDELTGSVSGELWAAVIYSIKRHMGLLRRKIEFVDLMTEIPDLMVVSLGP